MCAIEISSLYVKIHIYVDAHRYSLQLFSLTWNSILNALVGLVQASMRATASALKLKGTLPQS